MKKLLACVVAVLCVVSFAGMSFAGGGEEVNVAAVKAQECGPTCGPCPSCGSCHKSIPYSEPKLNENLAGFGTSTKNAGETIGCTVWGFFKECGAIIEGMGKTSGEIAVGAGKTTGCILKGAADQTGRMAVGAGQSVEGAGKQTGDIACNAGKNAVEHVKGAGQTTERMAKGAGTCLSCKSVHGGECGAAPVAADAQPEVK